MYPCRDQEARSNVCMLIILLSFRAYQISLKLFVASKYKGFNVVSCQNSKRSTGRILPFRSSNNYELNIIKGSANCSKIVYLTNLLPLLKNSEILLKIFKNIPVSQ